MYPISAMMIMLLILPSVKLLLRATECLINELLQWHAHLGPTCFGPWLHSRCLWFFCRMKMDVLLVRCLSLFVTRQVTNVSSLCQKLHPWGEYLVVKKRAPISSLYPQQFYRNISQGSFLFMIKSSLRGVCASSLT